VGKLIRSYRNDALPRIAVTVDLLTTGIDVPSITNLVFLRRVNSRILYEQMLGRATRRCDDIGKETFRVFDAVDLYPHLQNLTVMRPVVVDPSISLEQLFEEFARVEDDAHRTEIRDQILVKLRRRLRRLSDEARQQYEASVGEKPELTLERLGNQPLADTAAWARSRAAMQRILASRAWTDPQRKWLKRIAEQFEREIVVDRAALDHEPFQAHRGYRRLNKVFDGHLEAVLSDFNEELWRMTA
jgi:type I restriction enzyme, R subunit